jgi:hypothetical protein
LLAEEPMEILVTVILAICGALLGLIALWFMPRNEKVRRFRHQILDYIYIKEKTRLRALREKGDLEGLTEHKFAHDWFWDKVPSYCYWIYTVVRKSSAPKKEPELTPEQKIIEDIILDLQENPDNYSARWSGTGLDGSIRSKNRLVLILHEHGSFIEPPLRATGEQKKRLIKAMSPIVERDRQAIVQYYLDNKLK